MQKTAGKEEGPRAYRQRNRAVGKKDAGWVSPIWKIQDSPRKVSKIIGCLPSGALL